MKYLDIIVVFLVGLLTGAVLTLAYWNGRALYQYGPVYMIPLTATTSQLMTAYRG